MANYFRNIPKVKYDIFGTEPNKYRNVTNIMKRISFKPAVIEDISDYYPYRVKDGERPDIISHQKYGTVAYAYLIMLINDIYDPLFDWPLDSQQFERYLTNKYGSVSTAMGETKYIIKLFVQKLQKQEQVKEFQKSSLLLMRLHMIHLMQEIVQQKQHMNGKMN